MVPCQAAAGQMKVEERSPVLFPAPIQIALVSLCGSSSNTVKCSAAEKQHAGGRRKPSFEWSVAVGPSVLSVAFRRPLKPVRARVRDPSLSPPRSLFTFMEKRRRKLQTKEDREEIHLHCAEAEEYLCFPDQRLGSTFYPTTVSCSYVHHLIISPKMN